MNFNINHSINLLERTPSVLESLLAGLPDEWIHTNEGENTWSPFDIVGHLINGEKTDWINRTKIILNEDTDKHFPAFDRFSQFDASKGKTISDLIQEFKFVRNQNIQYLRSLDLLDLDLDKTGIHPDFGDVTLRQLLSAWTVHDLGHLNQITRVLAKNYDLEVGPWKKYLRVLDK